MVEDAGAVHGVTDMLSRHMAADARMAVCRYLQPASLFRCNVRAINVAELFTPPPPLLPSPPPPVVAHVRTHAFLLSQTIIADVFLGT